MSGVSVQTSRAATVLRPFAPMAGPLAPAAVEILDTLPRAIGPKIANYNLEEGWAKTKAALKGPKIKSPDIQPSHQRHLASYLNHLQSAGKIPYTDQNETSPIVSLNPDDQRSKNLTIAPPHPFQGVLCHHDQPNPTEPFITSKNHLGIQKRPDFPYFNIGPEPTLDRLSPKQMADKIESLDLPKGSPVLLFSCRAGLGGPNGEPSSAAQIAEQTGRPIVAPTAWVQVAEKNFVKLNNSKDGSAPKEWRIFYPDGRSETLPGIRN